MSITAYQVLTVDASFPDQLTKAVTDAIADGWQPTGAPVLVREKLLQAIVQGAPDGGGPTTVTIADVDGLQEALSGKLDTTGTAAAASKLATARTISGVSFDGTANIALTAANVGALATTGTAAAATKLATARTIAGHAFDGTANIAITAADVGAQPAA